MTKRELFERAIEIVNASGVEDSAKLVEKFEHEIEMLNRKSASTRKPTARQQENVELKAEIVAKLTEADVPMTIKELTESVEALNGMSNQRVSHLLKALREDGTVVRTYEKKVPYFSIA